MASPSPSPSPAPTDQAVEVRLHGAPQVWMPGKNAYVLNAKEAALFALLLVEGALPRARAAALLWPDNEADAAARNLRQRLFRIRRWAGRDLIIGRETLMLDSAVDRSGFGLPADSWSDPATAAPLHWPGAFDYADAPELNDWIEAARERILERQHRALASKCESFADQGRFAEALPLALHLVLADPLSEEAHRRVIRLHLHRGDVAAARAAYTRCAVVLRRELGVEPSAQTEQLATLVATDGAASPVRQAPPPAELLRPPRLVGRADTWRELESAWQLRRAVLLTGEPGIGKTRLARDFVAATAGVLVFDGWPADRRVAYSGLARMVRGLGLHFPSALAQPGLAELAHLLPDLFAVGPGNLVASRLDAAVVAVLRHALHQGLGGIVIDDLQFFDDASVELMGRLWSSPALSGLRWLLVVRLGQTPAAVEPWLAAGSIDQLVLRPWSPAELAELLTCLPLPGADPRSLAKRLWRHAGGHPLATLETLRAMFSRAPDDAFAEAAAPLPVPRRVEWLVEKRLENLSPDALRLLQLAAIADVDFCPALAETVFVGRAGELEAAWNELVAAQALDAHGRAHDIVREVAASRIAPARARQLHAAVAAWTASASVSAGRNAQHWLRAGQFDQAGTAFMRAATHARLLSRRAEEMALLTQAIECFDTTGDAPAGFQARLRAIEAGRYLLSYDEQLERARTLLGLARSDAERALAQEALAALLVDGDHNAAALDAAGAAGRWAESAGDAHRAMSAARIEARALAALDRQAEALSLLDRWRERALHGGGDTVAARLLHELASVLALADRYADALPLARHALVFAQQLNDRGLQAEIHTTIGWALSGRAHTLDSVQHYETALALQLELGQQPAPWSRHFVGLARQYKEVGRFADALRLFEDAVAAASGSREYTLGCVAMADLAQVWLQLGQPQRGSRWLTQPDSRAAPSARAAVNVARARVALWNGGDATTPLLEARELLGPGARAYYRLTVERDLALAAEPRLAIDIATRALHESALTENDSVTWSLRAAACDAARRNGDTVLAATLGGQIQQRFDREDPPGLYVPQTWWIVHQALAAAGLETAAAAALDRAGAWIRDTALPQVPAALAESFLRRNPINARVLEAFGSPAAVPIRAPSTPRSQARAPR